MVNNTPAGERQFKYCFNTPGVYIMSGMLSDIKGCSNTTTMAVIARDRPVGDFSFSPLNPVENEDEVLFEANNGAASGDKKISKWTWELDIESLRNKVQSSKSFNYIFKEAGMYPVVLTVENIYGCKDTVIKTIRVEEDFSAFVPSAFSPNGDNRNDIFMPVLRAVRDMRFEIFDRWGERVYETTTPGTGWDGTFRGQDCKQDVYIWKLRIKSNNTTLNSREKNMTGKVELIR